MDVKAPFDRCYADIDFLNCPFAEHLGLLLGLFARVWLPIGTNNAGDRRWTYDRDVRSFTIVLRGLKYDCIDMALISVNQALVVKCQILGHCLGWNIINVLVTWLNRPR